MNQPNNFTCDWTAVHHTTYNRNYYFNNKTRESVWVPPTEYVAFMSASVQWGASNNFQQEKESDRLTRLTDEVELRQVQKLQVGGEEMGDEAIRLAIIREDDKLAKQMEKKSTLPKPRSKIGIILYDEQCFIDVCDNTESGRLLKLRKVNESVRLYIEKIGNILEEENRGNIVELKGDDESERLRVYNLKMNQLNEQAEKRRLNNLRLGSNGTSNYPVQQSQQSTSLPIAQQTNYHSVQQQSTIQIAQQQIL